MTCLLLPLKNPAGFACGMIAGFGNPVITVIYTNRLYDFY